MRKIISLDIEDLVGNILITLKMNGYNTNKVSHSLINKYAQILYDKISERNIEPYIRLSRDETRAFLENNSNLYGEYEDGIELTSSLFLEELINRYRGYLSLDALMVIVDKDTVDRVLDLYRKENGIENPRVYNIQQTRNN